MSICNPKINTHDPITSTQDPRTKTHDPKPKVVTQNPDWLITLVDPSGKASRIPRVRTSKVATIVTTFEREK